MRRTPVSTSDDSKGKPVDRRRFLEGLAALGGGVTIAVSTAPWRNAAPVPPQSGSSPSGMASVATGPTEVRGGRGASDQRQESRDSAHLATSNGWYIQNGRAIWGDALHNDWWGGYRGLPTGWWTDSPLRPSLVRNAPGRSGPNLTEDLARLTDSMLAYGFPGFEHTPPLWYDRRRDAHDVQRRDDGHVVGPFLEMPWGRSHQGQAWDGLPLYDLTTFNPWYFARIKEFADLCDRKGCILFFNFYNQHNLLETQAHYCDFPWRPVNCLQATDLPDTTPAAQAFYDTTHPLRRELHRQYIGHCLDNLRDNRNVVFLTSLEYTGPLAFMQFWLETILEWERQAGRKVHIGLGATKDIVDAVFQDGRYHPRIDTIDLRYWHSTPDGSLVAPRGGQDVPGRYVGGADRMTPLQIYRQVQEYRRLCPDKAILHTIGADQAQTIAFLMAGGSMLLRGLDYVREYPATYEIPLGCQHILPVYEFLRTHLAADLPRMRPLDIVDNREVVWCLGEPGQAYLISMLSRPPGDPSRGFLSGAFHLDLSDAPGRFDARWIGLSLGTVFDAFGGSLEGAQVLNLAALDWRPWLLWLKKRTE